jgi:hypothetical protein
LRSKSDQRFSFSVIAGLDPTIHDELQRKLTVRMDHRVTPLGRFATCAAAR